MLAPLRRASPFPPSVRRPALARVASVLPSVQVGRYSNVPPVFSGRSRVADYGIKPRTGMTARLALLDQSDPRTPHPFKGLRAGRGSGQRLHLVLTVPSDEGTERTLYAGEAMLTSWAEDCRSGMSVTVRLDDGVDGVSAHPLSGMEPGQHSGEVIYMACWAVDDDEAVQHPTEARRVRRDPSAMWALQLSQSKCRDSEFRAWCRGPALADLSEAELSGLPDAEADPVAHAGAVVRAWCRIPSRSLLAKEGMDGDQARRRWEAMLAAFDEWRVNTPSD